MTRRLLITVVVAVVLLLAAILLYRNSFEQLRLYDRQVEHTHEVIYQYAELDGQLKSIKIYARNYPTFGERALLDRYISEVSAVRGRFALLRKLVDDNPEQQQRLDTLQRDVSRLFELTKAQVNASNPALIDSLNHLAIALMMSSTDPIVERGIAHEEQLLKERRNQTDSSARLLNVWIAVFILAALALLGVVIATGYEQFKRRQSAEDFLQSVLNTTQNGIVAYAAVVNGDEVTDFRVTFANRGIQNHLGRNPDALVGKTYFELWPNAPRDTSFDRFVNVYRSGVTDDYETRSIEPGSDDWFHVSVARMQDGVTVTFSNITHIKRYEEQLQQKIGELQRTNAELEQFAYVSSHDLQEPLRKIEMFSALADERHGEQMPSEALELLRKIRVSSQRMRALINDLLNYSRVSRSKEPFAPIDLNELMREVVNDFELVIDEKKAGLVLDALPVVEAVPLQINQLFQNMMSNSLKFTAPGRPPRVSVRSEPLSDDERAATPSLDPALDYCKIIWRDNGIGFDPRFADKVFTIFQRLHTRDEYEGTGIGLALCKKIALNHSGDILTVPTDGGAEFWILLPYAQPKMHVV